MTVTSLLCLSPSSRAFCSWPFGSPPLTARSKALVALRAVRWACCFDLAQPGPRPASEACRPAPTAVFLLDESRSMSLETPISRRRRSTTSSVAPMPSGVDRRPCDPEIWFGRDLTAVSESEKDHASGTPTKRDLVQALEQLPSRFGDTLPFGVFVFSDGRSTESDSLAETIGAGIPSLGRADPCRAGG